MLKPGGNFLLMVLAKDVWLNATFGPMLHHSGIRDAAWWSEALQSAGFTVAESGTRPATLYFVGRKRG